MALKNDKKPLIYALHSGNLYGTELMALAACNGLRDRFDCHIFAPDGRALKKAREMNFRAHPFEGAADFARQLRPILRAHDELAFIATGLAHSFALIALNVIYRRRITHLHIVHGGTDERLSYGRKKFLNSTSAKIVAVSNFVKQRLIAHGTRADKITTVENFLTPARLQYCPKKASVLADGVRRVAVVSRVDPIKRVDLLLDALDLAPELCDIEFNVYGTGAELEKLTRRAAEKNPNVRFFGFHDDVAGELVKADLLLHLCPTEPFGLAILEAFAARLPVLVPNAGGAGALVEPNVSGFQFRAGNAADLADKLSVLKRLSAAELNRVVAGGSAALKNRFDAARGIEHYRKLLEPDEIGNAVVRSEKFIENEA